MKRSSIHFLFLLVLAIPRPGLAQVPTGSDGVQPAAKATDDDSDPSARLIKTYPFRNSTFLWGQNLSALTLDRGAELTYDPVYSWLMRFQPRYYVTKQLQLRLKVGLAVEWTNADDTTTYHEPLWEDIWLDAVYGNLYKDRFTGIAVTPTLRFTLPVSKASRARSLYLGIAPGFNLMRGFKLPHHMTLNVAYAFSYTKYLNEYTTVQYEAPTIMTCTGGGGVCDRFSHSGARNPSHLFMNSFVVDWGITKKLKFSGMFGVVNALLYDLTPAAITVAGGTNVDVATDPHNNVSLRAAMIYSFELAYDVHPAISVSLGSYTYNPQLTEGSSYRAPFFNRYTELVLSTTISLDRIVAGIHRRVKPSALYAQAR
jgi:hypothetical protein